MRLSQLTCIIWCANMMLDRGESAPFTIAELNAAGREARLMDLFLKIDDSGIIEFAAQTDDSRRLIDDALADAYSALEGQFSRKAGVENNPLCLVLAIAVEAIQQKFSGSKA